METSQAEYQYMECLKMSEQIAIYDFETNQQIVRDMTEEEIAEHLKVAELDKEIKAELAAKETQRAALLNKLGITADEAKLLLG